LAEHQIDPQLVTIRPKARGHIPYGMQFSRSHFPYGFFVKTTRVLLKTFKRRTRGRLGPTREKFKPSQGLAGVPFSLGMLRVLLRTFGLWNSGTLGDYSSRPSRLLETIMLDYKVLEGLSYGHTWAHNSGRYQVRLLGGPLGLLDLCYTTPIGVERKDYRGIVLS
jgi:hypothetical protein